MASNASLGTPGATRLSRACILGRSYAQMQQEASVGPCTSNTGSQHATEKRETQHPKLYREARVLGNSVQGHRCTCMFVCACACNDVIDCACSCIVTPLSHERLTTRT
eukprot:9500406-Pyramimonas_sp.AAC.1